MEQKQCRSYALRVRDAGLVVLEGSKVKDFVMTRVDSIGIGMLQLSNIAYFVYSLKKKRELLPIAEHHKRCFGVAVDWPKERLDLCGAINGPGGALYDAGVSFGYIHPGTATDSSPDGGLTFWIRGILGDRRRLCVMGPQSVQLSDPKLLPYAIQRCNAACNALKKLMKANANVRCSASFHS